MKRIKILFKIITLIFVIVSCNNKNDKLTVKTISHYPNGIPKSKITLRGNDTIRQIFYDNKGRKDEEYFFKYVDWYPSGIAYKYYKYYLNEQIHNIVYLKDLHPIRETIFHSDSRMKTIIGYIQDIHYLGTEYLYDTINNKISLKKIVSYKRKSENIFSPMCHLSFKNNIIDTNNSYGYILTGKDTILPNQNYNFNIKFYDYSYMDSTFMEVIIGRIKDTTFQFIDTVWANSTWKKEFNITLDDTFDLGYNYFTGMIKTVSIDTAGQVYYEEIKFLHDFWVSESHESKGISFDPPLPKESINFLLSKDKN